MIYAINCKTKEHRAIGNMREKPNGVEWKILEADADGWIPWDGGKCPLPAGAVHEIKWNDGLVTKYDKPEMWNWGDDALSIVAYRPILDAEPMEAGGFSRTPIMDSYRDALRSDDRSEAPTTCEWRVGDKAVVKGVNCEIYYWWSENKEYEVFRRRNELGVFADDGDFYPIDGNRLAMGGRFEKVNEWDGEGLPPAGIRCEAFRSGGWQEVCIVGYCEKGFCVMDTGSAFKGNKNPANFRPLPTAAQRAEDEAIQDMADIAGCKNPNDEATLDICRKIYRAGYRKT